MTAKQQYPAGLILVCSAVIAWSLSGLFTRTLQVDTVTILFWRGIFGAAGMVVLGVALQGASILSDFRTLGTRGWAYAAVTSISMLFFVTSLRNTSVAHVAVITASVPFLAAILGWYFLKEPPQKSAIVASVISFFGVAIMVSLGTEGALAGDGMALCMALCMAAMILIARRFGNTPALATACLASVMTAAVTMPWANLVAVPHYDLIILALFGLVNQVAGFGLFALGAKHLPHMQTALLTALDAPLAPLWVWLVFAETPSTATFLGGLIVMSAVFGFMGIAPKK